ncbi:hypothetical protein BH10PSE7_BH10PSE7_04610 [soil metagenome]
MAGFARAFAALLALAGVLASASPAFSAAAPPFGHWRSRTSTAELYLYRNGACAFIGYNPVQGTCRWNPSSNGGILTLYYPMPLEPGKIYFNIVWINRTTITIFGERFYAQ